VTLVQRSPTLITNIEPSAQLAYAAYNEGTLEDNGAAIEQVLVELLGQLRNDWWLFSQQAAHRGRDQVVILQRALVIYAA